MTTNLPQRKIIRLKGYNYSQSGAYFITICIKDKQSGRAMLVPTLWQKSFHDRIIRNEAEYRKIWEYIDTNPLKWHEDCYFNENNC